MLEWEHGLLWSSPGTGKTLTAIEVIRKGGFLRALVIAPTIAVAMWKESIETQLGNKVVEGTSSKKLLNYLGKDWPAGEVVVTTYGIASNHECAEALKSYLLIDDESIVVLDEAHYCKDRSSKRSQVIAAPRPKVSSVDMSKFGGPKKVDVDQRNSGGLITAADYVLMLTGTPILRYPDDLYMQLAHVRASVLKEFGVDSYHKFTQKFCQMKEVYFGARPRWVTSGGKNLAELARLMDACKPVRRSLNEVVNNLPDLSIRTIPIKVTTKFKSDLSDEQIVNDLNKAGDKKNQHYAQIYKELGIEKSRNIKDYLNEVVSARSVLIGYLHTDARRVLQAALKDHAVAVIDGNTPSKKRVEIQNDFNYGKVRVILGQINALNVSLNLQETAHHVIVVEQPASPGVLEQFIARVYRKGQRKRTLVDLIVAENRLDKAIVNIRNTKEAVTTYLMGEI